MFHCTGHMVKARAPLEHEEESAVCLADARGPADWRREPNSLEKTLLRAALLWPGGQGPFRCLFLAPVEGPRVRGGRQS